MSIVLKIGGSYQEHMILREVARNRFPMGGAPDTETFQKILIQKYLVNGQK